MWLSLYLVSVSWLFVTPVYEPPRTVVWAFMMVVASALAAVGLRSMHFDVSRHATAAVGLPAAVAAILVPFPYSAGPLFMASGCVLLYVIAGRRGAFTGAGLVWTGAIASVQTLAFALHWALAPHYSDLGFLGIPAAGLLRVLGVSATPAPDGLLVHTGAQTLIYSLTWEKFGVLPVLLFLVGALPLLALSVRGLRKLPALIAIVAVYAAVRFVVLALMYAAGGHLQAFWSGAVAAVSLLPLAIVVSWLLRLERRRSIEWRPTMQPRRAFVVATALVFLGGTLLVGAWVFEEPGVRKPGRVLIDELHSDWEWTTEEYDTEWYGRKSGYNYYSLYEYLNLFYTMERNHDPLTEEAISGQDVLVIKTPTTPFATEEIDAVVEFVRQGGGLLLIGDHTNVFGTSTNMNPLAERFGIYFNHDSTYELNAGHLSEYEAPRVAPHPVVQHLPQTFLFATSSTLTISSGVTSAITGYGLKALEADYSQKNFFPAVTASPEMRYGLFVQGAATRFGRGRVAAFSDSTVFSNFWMFMPGKPELLLGYMDWVNRENAMPDARWLLVALGVTALGAAVLPMRRLIRAEVVLAIYIGSALAIPFSLYASGQLNRVTHPPPDARMEFARISFEQEYSDFMLPSTYEGFIADVTRRLDTFYVWNQRLGYVPSLHQTLEGALAAGQVVVLVDPGRAPGMADPVDADDVAAVVEYVEDGGRLLVLDRAAGDGDTANALLETFGMRFDHEALEEPTVVTEGGGVLRLTEAACSVSGGDPLLVTGDDDVVCAGVSRGAGLVVAFGDSALFFNDSMGDVSAVPSERQRLIGDLEFAIMRHLVEGVGFEY